MTQQIGSANYPLFRKDIERLTGREAWRHNLRLASLAGSKVASCLGPKGSYKLVTYHRGPELVTKVTKDPVDMVDELGVQYPAIKTLAEAAKIHREEVGDGVSTLLVLISALLEEADRLMREGVHPIAILDGYFEAAKKSLGIIDETAKNFGEDLDEWLLNIVDCGRGLLTKNLQQELVEAISRVEEDGEIDLGRIRIVTKSGGIVQDSRLVRGVIIKKGKAHYSMPDEIDAPRVALVARKLELKPLELLMKGEGPPPTVLNIREARQLQMFKAEESRLRAQLAERVRSAGANVLICRSRIEERIADLLSRAGVFALQLVDQDHLEEVAKGTGARIVGDASLLTQADIGVAGKLEVDKIRPEQVVILYCEKAATLLLRGSSPELVDELEKTVKKALLVLKQSRSNSKIIPGGGAIFAELAMRLRTFALGFAGREQLAVKSFADAMETVPRWLSINNGLNPIDAMMQLRSYHSNGREAMGVGVEGCADMFESNVVELASVNKATLRRIFDVVSLLLRIDDYFYVKEIPLFHKQ